MWSEAREDYGKPWTTRDDDDEETVEGSKEKEKSRKQGKGRMMENLNCERSW